jgi:signal transduction histidine kinase
MGLTVTDTAGVHDLFHSVVATSETGPFLVFDPTPLFQAAFLLEMGLIAVGLAFVARLFLRSRHVSRRQAAALAAGAVPAVAVHVLFLLGRARAPDIGLAIVAFGATTGWALFSQQLFVADPVARDVVLDDIEDGVVVVSDGRLVDYNRVAAEVFPALRDGLGREPTAVLPADVLDGSRERVTAAVDGADHVFEVSRTALTDEGVRRGTLVTLRDVTELTAYADELERQTEHLERFASTVSHDLRNPLTVAQAYVDRARETESEAPLDEVDDVLQEMERLIDEALTLAREGRTIDERASVSLHSVAADAWHTSDTAEATLVNEVDPGRHLSADRARLSRVFENLFRNAVDHGSRTATVRVGTHPGGFYVEDDGPGIPPEQREAVFEQGRTTREDGTGFGLAIVESIVEAHGWTVHVTEGSDGGARFVVEGVDSLGDRPGPPRPDDDPVAAAGDP